LKRLSGAWVFVDAEQGGKTYTDADLNRKRCEFVITGDAFTTFVDGRVVQTGSFTIDPSKTPKTIDVEISPPLAGHMPGIYEVDGGRIKVCWGPINGERPTSLNSPPGALCWSIRGKRK
jgi:uncharacterized protein (TIGR03067 family)